MTTFGSGSCGQPCYFVFRRPLDIVKKSFLHLGLYKRCLKEEKVTFNWDLFVNKLSNFVKFCFCVIFPRKKQHLAIFKISKYFFQLKVTNWKRSHFC